MQDEVTQAPINMNAIVLQIEAASERDQMWHRRWKALRALNYHNTNFVDQDGPWTLADFIAYAGEVCGFKPDDDASTHRHQAERETLARMEPVAWMYERKGKVRIDYSPTCSEDMTGGWTATPLYALPPAPEAGQ